MRQYIIIGIVYLLAATSFFFFIVNGDNRLDDHDELHWDGITSNPGMEENVEQTEPTEQQEAEPEQKEETNQSDNSMEANEEAVVNGESTDEIIWGVDSASYTTEEFYGCVQANFGEPEIWGRYLEDKDGVSYGLTTEEVQLLHSEGVSILVIYNHFTDGTTYEKGVAEAEQAIAYAEALGVPEGVALFANVEPEYPIDANFILGWYDTIEPSIYHPAIYGLFTEGSDVWVAYEEAVAENAEIGESYIVWSNQPQIGITTEDNAPDEYNVEAPENARNWAWQYGLDAETCNIDTNLFDAAIFDYVWQPEE